MKKLLFLLTIALLTVSVASAQDGIEDIASRVVLIGIVQDGEIVGNGSGTLVSADGRIYTNRHVVEESEDLAIFILEDIQELPVFRYLASVEFVSQDIDFAIIQIDRDTDGNRLDSATLNLPFVPVAPADVHVGDFIRVFGYPGIGDGYMVVTSGEIVTIQNGNVGGDRLPVWYRTDTEFSGGNSGGLALNESGQVVGIPTWVVSEERTAGKLGGILPISTVIAVANRGSDVVESPQTTTEMVSFTLNNTSESTVCYVFISPTTATSWGEDQLEEQETIQPGTSRTFEVMADYYDVLLKDCSQADLSDTRNVDVTAASALNFTGTDDTGPIEQRDQLSQSEIAGGVGVTCDLDENNTVAFDNGVEIVFSQMPSDVTYTATVIGINGFDPVLAVLDTDTRAGSCADDSASAGEYVANLPSSGQVAASERNPQVVFTQDSGAAAADRSVIVGGYNNTSGEFVLVVEGLTLEATDGIGDLFSVRLTASLLQSGTALTMYMVAVTNDLDPLMYLGNPDTLEPFVDGAGLVVTCDDAGNAEICWGESTDLSNSSITVQTNRNLPGGTRDAMLTIPLEGLQIDPNEDLYFNFILTSYEQLTTGPYAMVFHIGTR